MFAANEEIKSRFLECHCKKKNIIGTWESFSSNGCSIMA